VNDAVDRLIIERAALDRGFSRGLVLSIVAHVALVAAAFAGPMLFPKKPIPKIALGMAVPLPPGGGGASAPQPPAPAPEPAKPEPPAPQPEKAPKVVKPPKEAERKGLPAPDAKKSKKAATATPAPAKAAAGVAGGTGTATAAHAFDGLDIGGMPGPGFGGNDPYGDYYMASVKRKIWTVWRSKITTGMTDPIIIRFTILADGSVTDVQVTQPGNAGHLNTAAQSAVITAAPFSPLPKHYETDRKTVDALFRPQQQ
jgi:TonB family protein